MGERTKTAEELAAEEEQRLQRLEAQRLKRLRGPSGDDLGDGGSGSEKDGDTAGLSGFAARRAKRRKREAAGLKPLHTPNLAVVGCISTTWLACLLSASLFPFCA